MARTNNLFILIFCATCICLTVSGKPTRNITTLSGALHDIEEFILNTKENYNAPSIAFGVSVKGKTVLAKAWGFADLENEVPAKVTTKYRLASVSKQFTSAMIGKLVDQGLVHYDDPLSKHVKLTDFPKKTWQGKPVKITIGQLLSHTAGIRFSLPTDFTNIVRADNVTMGIRKFANDPLIFEPGTAYA